MGIWARFCAVGLLSTGFVVEGSLCFLDTVVLGVPVVGIEATVRV